LQFGEENFCMKCAEVGIESLILPDLPLLEYKEQYKNLYEQCNLYPIFLITPQTSQARIRKIDSLSKGFIYASSFQKACQYAEGAITGSAYIKYIQVSEDFGKTSTEF